MNKYQSTLLAQDSTKEEIQKADLDLLGKINTVVESLTETQNGQEKIILDSSIKNPIKVYDLSASDITMAQAECEYNIIELSGTLTTNRTFNFYLDATKLYGSKAYRVLVSAISDSTTTRNIILSSSGSIDMSIPVKSDTLPQLHDIYIDSSGNVKAGIEGYIIIEEGTNSNGSWIKFSNGTLICYKYNGNVGYYNQQSNMYGTTSGYTAYGTASFTFPVAFIDTPAGSSSAGSGDPANTRFIPASGNGGLLTWSDISSSTGSHGVSWIAIGRWK